MSFGNAGCMKLIWMDILKLRLLPVLDGLSKSLISKVIIDKSGDSTSGV